ncbi:tetratricopeptide repeat protein [Spirosoma taeanense]|uniref:Tetratricopeptide repeat protein n=1 Tax=Spirosoma taeanense TaxID=2735870 RepID=A0A6M5Y3D1_9BACT|nr:tetratricopeptide repeat protein [Spirosoma taeanense]QJW89088.1 tetratricopeptide repeat protein [Spirosoma taeanense]
MITNNYVPNDFRAYLGSILFSVDYDFGAAETHLTESLSRNPSSALFILLLCQLYQKQIEYNTSANGDTMNEESKLGNYAQQGIELLAKKPRSSWNDGDYRYQGEFQSFLSRLEEAKLSFQKAIQLNPDLVEGRTGLGIVYQKLKKWNDALIAFEQARRLDPNDLNTRASMAEMLIELDQFNPAEEHLAFIRRITDETHLDALILSGRLYARLGDKAHENEDAVEAEGRYRAAVEFLDKALRAETYGNYSRKITPTESHTVRYLNGYCQIKQIQAREKKGNLVQRYQFAQESQRYIDKALVHFKKITESKYAHNGFEARQAVNQLNQYRKQTSPVREISTRGLKGTLVVMMAAFILIATQIVFFFRETSFVRAITQPNVACYIQPSRIQPLLKLDSAGDVKLTRFARLSFNHPDSLIARWEQLMGENVRIERAWIENADQKPERLLTEGFYGLITFASLLFIIAGLVLPELTKLKVGSIELEKTRLETITTTPSLNVSSGASATRSLK